MDSQTLIGLYQSGIRDFTGSDLRQVRIPSADLSESNFSGCDFTGAVLGGATLDRCNFTEAILTECNGIGASFVEADFTRTNIPGRAAFGQADFFRCKFIETRMTGNFREAFF